LSVVTRTRNRLIFLRRAARSIKSAAPKGTEWIIVNDGGDADEIERLVSTIETNTNIEIRLVSTAHQGRGAAANAGLALARGAYFHLHDDDDTVDPDFYRATIGFLKANPRFGGVCTHTTRVEEEVQQDNIRSIRRRPHNPELTAVTFAKLATSFLFPPISFLARTSCCREVGEFDTAADIPEDYDFDLRFLEKFDIGVIRRELSFIHQRRNGTAGSNGDWAHAPASMDIETYNA
ncbi:glycosyltransferase, partial [Rhizobiaceae sp. 2RAB30]